MALHPQSPSRAAIARPALARRVKRAALTAGLMGALGVAAGVASAVPASADSSGGTTQSQPGAAGIAPGKIKHVWLIILENKSYDASFTGLNNNTYLWQDLPRQGALLKQYYATGHSSLDNYTTLVSGQAPVTDLQRNCPNYNVQNGAVDLSGGSLAANPNYGQFTNAAGPESVPGKGAGCVYPSSVPTLFNQLDQAGVSWKGYAQDLGNPDTSGPTHSAGTQYCGAPYANPDTNPAGTAQPNPNGANATDQYVPKHFPFPWFSSLRAAGDCNDQHIANLFDANNGLYHDLQSETTTPAFSWISPNNCSDAHDAVCAGNNLSGGFSDPNTPNPPQNYTGGLYASDLFLQHVIPMIEASPAFKDGGLIDVTFDEAYPAFTYSDSFVNSPFTAPGVQTALYTDSAGQTINGVGQNTEPTGPNTPLATDASGNQLYPGPGLNAGLDRASTCTNAAQPICQGNGGRPPGPKDDPGASSPAGSSVITDNGSAPGVRQATAPKYGTASSLDQGRAVSDTAGNIPTTAGGNGTPACCFVGYVAAKPVDATSPAGTATATSPIGQGSVDQSYFTIVDGNGNLVKTTGAIVPGNDTVTFGAQTAANDPAYDTTDPTPGGGRTGSVLISPYITPGTTSDVKYNHYSWLRTIEDLFGVAAASPGLDGLGHIGYAAQPGLAPFGSDVFTNPSGQSQSGN